MTVTFQVRESPWTYSDLRRGDFLHELTLMDSHPDLSSGQGEFPPQSHLVGSDHEVHCSERCKVCEVSSAVK